MESLRELFKIGFGPSSSHTMGPQRAASKIKEQYPNASRFEVELYGSLALTGKGHLTDYIIKQTLGKQTIVRFKSDRLPYHPNGMKEVSCNKQNKSILIKILKKLFNILKTMVFPSMIMF